MVGIRYGYFTTYLYFYCLGLFSSSERSCHIGFNTVKYWAHVLSTRAEIAFLELDPFELAK